MMRDRVATKIYAVICVFSSGRTMSVRIRNTDLRFERSKMKQHPSQVRDALEPIPSGAQSSTRGAIPVRNSGIFLDRLRTAVRPTDRGTAASQPAPTGAP